MAEYIERQKAIEEFEQCNTKKPQWTPQRVKTLLLRIPTVDAMPVVRCKDCKYHREINEREREYLRPDVFICTNAEFIDDGWNPVWPDDFCSCGERSIE